MKKTLLSLTLVSLLLSGCASYSASDLTALPPHLVHEYDEIEVAIGCKEYTKSDCETYLDRDVIKQGFQPVQLTFYNASENPYIFSRTCISLPCATPQEVAKTVQTSTTGRIVSYGLGSLVFSPLLIPAIVDGIRSYKANQRLDEDFYDKTRDYFVIAPKTFQKTLFFVPVQGYCPTFNLTLFDEKSGEQKTVTLKAQK